MNLKSLAYCLVFATASAIVGGDYAKRPDVNEFVAKIVSEHGFHEAEVRSVLNTAVYQQAIIDLISKPAEKKPWSFYRTIFVTPTRINDGVQFAKENLETLKRAEAEFGVPIEIVTAIIGVETNYGRNTGRYRVLDALATLGFDYPARASFFVGQLEEFLVLACEERVKPFNGDDACRRETSGNALGSTFAIGDLLGSYAGAMGYGQFIPSSYRNFAIDFDQDGARDIWHNVVDAIGSVAAYFKDHGWERGEPVIVQVEVGDDRTVLDALANASYTPTKTVAEWHALGVITAGIHLDRYASIFRYESEDSIRYYFGFHNFYVITRYNISRLYAKAVIEVAEGIAAQL